MCRVFEVHAELQLFAVYSSSVVNATAAASLHVQDVLSIAVL